MIFRLLFVVTVVAMLYSNCKTSQTTNTTSTNTAISSPPSPDSFATTEKILYGHWDWFKTNCCGRTPRITTPETTQTTAGKNFKTDGTVELIKNDSVLETVKYKILPGYQDDKNIMISIGNSRAGYLRIKGDTIIIDYGYVDLQTEWYVRRKK